MNMHHHCRRRRRCGKSALPRGDHRPLRVDQREELLHESPHRKKYSNVFGLGSVGLVPVREVLLEL